MQSSHLNIDFRPYHKLGTILDYYSGLILAITVLGLIFNIFASGFFFASIGGSTIENQKIILYQYFMRGILFGEIFFSGLYYLSDLIFLVKLSALTKFNWDFKKIIQQTYILLGCNVILGIIMIVTGILRTESRLAIALTNLNFDHINTNNLIDYQAVAMGREVSIKIISLLSRIISIITYINLSRIGFRMVKKHGKNNKAKQFLKAQSFAITASILISISEILRNIPELNLQWGINVLGYFMLEISLAQAAKTIFGYISNLSYWGYRKKSKTDFHREKANLSPVTNPLNETIW